MKKGTKEFQDALVAFTEYKLDLKEKMNSGEISKDEFRRLIRQRLKELGL